MKALSTRSRQVNTVLVVAIAGLALVALIRLLIAAGAVDWLPVGDHVAMKLRALDVGTSETPLVGVYSRFGWNHPGPMLFYALAGPLRLSGLADNSMLFTAIAINLGAMAAALWMAARVRRDTLALTALFIALLCLGLNLGTLADPWNPYVILLPMFAAIIAAWRITAGDRVAGIVLVVAGSFAVQSHLGSAPVMLAVTACGRLGLGLRIRSDQDRERDVRTLLWMLGIAALCWLPPVIGELTGGGNLRAIGSFLLHGEGTVNGFADGARIIGRALSIPGNWVRGAEPVQGDWCWRCTSGHVDSGSWPIPWALFALVGSTVWAWRRRWHDELRLCLVALVAILAAFLAASRVEGVVVPYLVRWVWVVAAAAWFAVGIVVLAAIRTRSADLGARLGAVATIVVLAILVIAGPNLDPLTGYESWNRTIKAVVDPSLDAIATAPGPVLIRSNFSVDGAVASAILERAEERGLDVRRTDDLAYIFGDHRTIVPTDAASELVVIAGEGRIELLADPRFREIVSYDPLSVDERNELDAIERRHGLVPAAAGTVGTAALPNRTVFDAWRDAEFASANRSQDFLRYRELTLRGDVVSVFFADTPPLS